ncbi:DNA modification methylase [Nocardia terpenica]|uniref:DNA modification methylase n=1 Tax=Nocardia terpenica TaxID=455432 RepID=UPI000AAA0978|nr:DNA methyltransferase [Nocardia terpenica]
MSTPVTGIRFAALAVAELSTFAGNPRRGDVDAIAASLQATGQYRPIVVNEGTLTGRVMEVLAGNHTLLAARQLGWERVEAGVIDVDEQTARRIVAADNRTADLGDYDYTALFELLDGLDDLAGTGYTPADFEKLAAAIIPRESRTDPEEVPDVSEDVISVPGDIWQLGPHRLAVGDATEYSVVEALMAGGQADCVWTDPPYGVDYVGKTRDALRIRNDGNADLDDLLGGAFASMVAVSRPGAPVYVAHADSERVRFEGALRRAGVLVRQNLVWVKNSIVMGRSDYHYRHEPILYGFIPGGDGRLGRGGDRWFGDNAAATVFEVDKPVANRDHPTMKPVALIEAMLANSLRPGGVVLDLFGGSGSTLMAAHGHGSAARLIELDPRYADVICRRFQEHTGLVPVRDDGETVDFMASRNR